MEKRRQYIRDNYSLSQNPHTGNWEAIIHGRVRHYGVDRARVIMTARSWHHFNFEDEAEEFNLIFPAHEAFHV